MVVWVLHLCVLVLSLVLEEVQCGLLMFRTVLLCELAPSARRTRARRHARKRAVVDSAAVSMCASGLNAPEWAEDVVHVYAEDVLCDVPPASAGGHSVCGMPPVCGAAEAKAVTPVCGKVDTPAEPSVC
jgi:hypothetical protein